MSKKEIVQPSKQIVSPTGQAMSSRPAMSDQQAIERILGGFLNFLRMNGIPTPTKAELRTLMYERCFVDYLKAVREQEEQQWQALKSNMPRLQRAAAMVDEEDRKAREEAEKKAAEGKEEKKGPVVEVVEGGKNDTAEQKGE